MAPSLRASKQSFYDCWWAFIDKEATFFRLHLIAFTLIPLIASAIFHACNGRFPVKYIDSVFLCYSSMTVTGLSTVNLSTLTVIQQVILYVLMAIGDITTVSWIMVLFRKNYFVNECEMRVYKDPGLARRIFRKFTNAPPSNSPDANEVQTGVQVISPTPQPTVLGKPKDKSPFVDFSFTASPEQEVVSLPPEGSGVGHATSITLTHPIPGTHVLRERLPTANRRVTYLAPPYIGEPGSTVTHPATPGPTAAKYLGEGGFPGPVDLAQKAARRMVPRLYRKLERHFTIPPAQIVNGYGTDKPVPPPGMDDDQKSVSWLGFAGLIVGRNSAFQLEELSDEQLEEIGGTEYKALRLLSYLVPAYFVLTQLFTYILFAPWLSTTTKYDAVFAAQPREVKKPWFSLFQVMSAYTGGGMSLVDQGMLPFADAYLMIFPLIFVILAGNHATPIFLRFIIWVWSHCVGRDTDNYKALSFLLDHPRRCFIYLFPSHQTWFLLIVLVVFSAIEWAAFEVLNLGLSAFQSIPIGPRVVSGLFQGISARASGFGIAPLASLAPAVQFLYVVMMYIAIYPIAISIRSTNVYEEKSLGVYEVEPQQAMEEPTLQGSRRERIHKYIGWHLRRQTSNDIWWLVCAVFIIAITERKQLMDEDKKWFDMFRVLFELVSAFGGIGLSLGVPFDNFSFVGALRPLSKLVVIVIMVKGRHRGLPVAIDRAVLLPVEHSKHQNPGPTSPTRSARNGTAV